MKASGDGPTGYCAIGCPLAIISYTNSRWQVEMRRTGQLRRSRRGFNVFFFVELQDQDPYNEEGAGTAKALAGLSVGIWWPLGFR